MRLQVLFFSLLVATHALFAQTMHPTFPLLDQDGQNVLHTGKAISTMTTCGNCHDTQYIASHNYHSMVGFSEMTAPGKSSSGRAWDTGPGSYGQWNPLFYRYLSPVGDDRVDLTTPDWLKIYGVRHVGGGPAETGRDGVPHLQRLPDVNDADASTIDPQTGQSQPWDWSESGIVEINCFLCHIQNPNNSERIRAIQQGRFGWANTATLVGAGIVNKSAKGWAYERAAFNANGDLAKDFAQMQDPTNKNCGQCHGLVHSERDNPLINKGCQHNQLLTETTGQIISPQRLSDSGINLKNKESLSRSWDVHAERVLKCTDCHYSINNPIYYRENEKSRPAHLLFSPRRADISDYLYRPSHEFARGQSSYEHLALSRQGTMRRCESCHDYEKTHNWLPYRERHIQSMTCESCHVPHMFSPARRVYDWTMITPDGSPRTECRGLLGPHNDPKTIVEGYDPVLLPRKELDGRVRLAPYNLITFWYWTYGEPERPVRLFDLRQAFLQGAAFHPDVITALDENGNGHVEESELILDTPEKVRIMRSRLEAMGLTNVKIQSEIQPYAIHHDVARGDWVTKDCESCHTKDSRLTRAFLLAEHSPTDEPPTRVRTSNVMAAGKIYFDQGKLFYKAAALPAGFFILGHDKVFLVQLVGAATVLLVLFGVIIHGGLRVLAARRSKKEQVATKTVYMYSFYERFWHWLQAIAIIGLIFTGLIVHAPDVFGLFSFSTAVYVHNALALVLLINAVLAVFYHFASGEIRNYLIEPKGFFSQAITQATFYLKGIFRGEKHPFEKTPDKKLNPLQKITYVAILNILLPLQIITGMLIWGAQHFPKFLAGIGGLGLLVPVHSLIAWFFAAFLIMHLYLTTTGHTVTSAIKAMVVGWEKVEDTEENVHA